MMAKIDKLKADTDAALNSDAQEEISRCTVQLLRSEPFFGHILGGIQRHFTSSISTLAVGLRGDSIQLMVNPLFLLKSLTKFENRVAVLKHEILHIVFRHVFRNKNLSHDPKLWNIATDLVVNQYVAPYKLPENAILLSTFSDLDLVPEDTADNYYDTLKKLQNDISNKSSTKKKNSFPESAKALNEILSKYSPSDHTFWVDSDSDDLDGELTGSAIPEMVRDALKEIIEDQILKAFERAKTSKIPGSIPGWLVRHVNELNESRKPKINWRNTLRQFSASMRRSEMVVTNQRISKRFEPTDGMPPNPGLKLKRFQNIAVAIDTSGSIDEDQICQFFGEINGIYKQGAFITIVECDVRINRSYLYDGKTPSFVKGGGGTSFEPVMKWLNNSNHRFDGCVYLTDGYAEPPVTKPYCKLLWVLVNGEGGEHLRFGRQLKII